jgi:hypothetical protein
MAVAFRRLVLSGLNNVLDLMKGEGAWGWISA